MKIERIVGGVLESNGYILSVKKEAIIIDPGYNPRKFLNYLHENDLKLKAVILTHLHSDHVGAAHRIGVETGASIYMHRDDAAVYGGHVDVILDDRDVLHLGDELLEIIHTPGHTKGSICIMCPKSRICFTGDTVFDTDLGRTDLKGGSEEDMRKTVTKVISSWSNDIYIYPGHDEGASMKFVRRYNEEYRSMLPIKIIGLDLDGTSLAPDGRFSAKTKEVFEKAYNSGVHIIIATGRAYHSLPDEIFQIKGIQYAVTSNGAKVFRLKDRKLIFENCIKAEAVEDVCALLKSENAHVEVFTDGRAYISKNEYEQIRDYKMPFRDREYVLKTRNTVDDIFDFMLENKSNIENISVNYEKDILKDSMYEKLMKINGITVTSSFKCNHEIGGLTTNKATGLNYILKMLNIGFESLMVCGDSHNDLAMIEEARIGVAMGDADEDIKKASDFVTKTSAEDGVAYAIEKFVFKA